jgi:hypothetical protein
MNYSICNFMFLLLFLTSCSKRNQEIVGTYTSESPTQSELFFDYLSNSKCLYGTNLKISQDSTFNLENCSQRIDGNWKISGDTLLLYCMKKEFVIDSLNFSEHYKKYLECDTKPSFYLIKEGELEFRLNSDQFVLYETLKRVED